MSAGRLLPQPVEIEATPERPRFNPYQFMRY
jgi:hypothetical protein